MASGELWRSIILFTVLIFKILILSHTNRTLFSLFATMSNYLSTELSYFFSIITQDWQPYRRCLTYRIWNWILIHYLQYSSIQPHSKTPFNATFDFFLWITRWLASLYFICLIHSSSQRAHLPNTPSGSLEISHLHHITFTSVFCSPHLRQLTMPY